MAHCWRLAPQVEISLRCWEDECALYAHPGGNTHILPLDLGVAIQHIQQAPCTTDTLAKIINVSEDLLRDRLEALARLGLIKTADE